MIVLPFISLRRPFHFDFEVRLPKRDTVRVNGYELAQMPANQSQQSNCLICRGILDAEMRRCVKKHKTRIVDRARTRTVDRLGRKGTRVRLSASNLHAHQDSNTISPLTASDPARVLLTSRLALDTYINHATEIRLGTIQKA